jgi:hypothetical protein
MNLSENSFLGLSLRQPALSETKGSNPFIAKAEIAS